MPLTLVKDSNSSSSSKKRASPKRILLGKVDIMRQARRGREHEGDFAIFVLFRSAESHTAATPAPSVTFIFLSSGHYMKRKRQTVHSHPSSSDDGDNTLEMPSKLSIFPYRYIERNFP
jgi:hypothetical protein